MKVLLIACLLFASALAQTVCSGKVEAHETCDKCKCSGIELVKNPHHSYGVTLRQCTEDAYAAGHTFFSYRADGECVYGSYDGLDFSEEDACTTSKFAPTEWAWKIYRLQCLAHPCYGVMSETQVCTNCKCNGASKRTAQPYKTKEHCEFHAFSEGYTYYNWRGDRELCVFASDDACTTDKIIGVNYEWGIYQMDCDEPICEPHIGQNLNGVPVGATTCLSGNSCSFETAMDYCLDLSNCGGVVLDSGEYQVRAGSSLIASTTGAVSWLKADCANTEDWYTYLTGPCRTAGGGQGTFLLSIISDTIEECRAECVTSNPCVGWEFNPVNGRCEIHTETITHSDPSVSATTICGIPKWTPFITTP